MKWSFYLDTLESGFPPGMFERGGPKRAEGLRVVNQEKKNQIF